MYVSFYNVTQWCTLHYKNIIKDTVKKMFLFLNFSCILKLIYFKTLNQVNPSSFKIREFSSFNQILLILFDNFKCVL